MSDLATPILIEKGEFKVGRKRFRYQVNGAPCRSVTEILEVVFGKGKFGAGAWWGMETGVKGTLKVLGETPASFSDPDEVIALLKEKKLTTNHVKSDAADRGTAIHDAAEKYALTGEIPNPMDYPEEYRGYLRAFAMFLVDERPEFLDTEVTVASAEHGYAGTFDMRARLASYEGVGLGDYKTGKRLYESVFFQLEAYELAAVEMGNAPTDYRFAVQLSADGTYGIELSNVYPEEWVAQVVAWKAQTAAEERRKVK